MITLLSCLTKTYSFESEEQEQKKGPDVVDMFPDVFLRPGKIRTEKSDLFMFKNKTDHLKFVMQKSEATS